MSGRATVIGFTVNSQQWLPKMAPPYVIANVALAEDPGVRLTTNIVGCDPDDVHIGQEVEVDALDTDQGDLGAVHDDDFCSRVLHDLGDRSTHAGGAADDESALAVVGEGIEQ